MLLQALCIWCTSWDSCNEHNTKFSQSYLQLSPSGPCNFLLWTGFLVSTGRSLDLLAPLEISPAPWAEPRRAERAMDPKKCLEGSSCQRPTRKSCWRCQKSVLGSAWNRAQGSGRADCPQRGSKRKEKKKSVFLIHNSLNQYFWMDIEITKKETKSDKKTDINLGQFFGWESCFN